MRGCFKVKIRLKISIAGTFHGIDGGVKVGDVVEVDDMSGANYVASGYAEEVKPGRRSEEHALADMSAEEHAVLATEIIGASNKPVPQSRAPRPPKAEPKAEPKSKPVYGKTNPPEAPKRGPGRPRKST
jgi:hypothetical protein